MAHLPTVVRSFDPYSGNTTTPTSHSVHHQHVVSNDTTTMNDHHRYKLPQKMGWLCLNRSEYLHRMIDFQQVDWEFAIAQMICLCLTPRKVYQFVDYRRQTKNTMARDDPGFVILLMALLTITSLAYCIALQIPLSGRFILALFFPAFIYICSGIIIASAIYYLARYQKQLRGHFLKYNITSYNSPDTTQVEWIYCFDVHSNGTFPVFLICSVIQYLLLPLLIKLVPNFLSTTISNSLYAIAGCYYCYIASLGYCKLSMLPNAVLLLYPTVVIIILAVCMTLLGINMTKLYLKIWKILFS